MRCSATPQGSVVVDLAAPTGGNVALTRKGETYRHKELGVTFIGVSNLAATMPAQASELYTANIRALLDHLGGADKFDAQVKERTDPIAKGTTVTFGGAVVYEPPAPPPAAAPKPAPAAHAATIRAAPEPAAEPLLSPGASFAVQLLEGDVTPDI